MVMKNRLPKGLFRRGKIIWIRFKNEKGIWVNRSLHTTDLTSARRMQQNLLYQVESRRRELQGGAPAPLPIAKAVDVYLQAMKGEVRPSSWEKKAVAIKYLQRFLQERGITYLQDVTSQHLEDFKAYRRNTAFRTNVSVPVAPNTINSTIGQTKAFFGYFFQRGVLQTNPAAKLRKVDANPRLEYHIYTPQEVRAMFNASENNERTGRCYISSSYLKRLLILLYYSGMRLAEATHLTWKDVDLERRTITIRHSKFKRQTGSLVRTIPMHDEIYKMLSKCQRRDGLILLNSIGQPVSNNTAHRSFVLLLKRLRIPHGRLHDFRHTFATELARRGCDPYRLQKLLGHARLETTMRYYDHLVIEDLRSGLALLTHE